MSALKGNTLVIAVLLVMVAVGTKTAHAWLLGPSNLPSCLSSYADKTESQYARKYVELACQDYFLSTTTKVEREVYECIIRRLSGVSSDRIGRERLYKCTGVD